MPIPQEVLAELEPHINDVVTKRVDEQLAERLAATGGTQPGRAPGILKYKGMFDTEQPAHAALGLRIKRSFLEFEDKHNRESSRAKNKGLREFLDKVKAAGVFESVFGEGGSLFARESVSEEIIDVLRNASILLKMGCRVESGYGAKLTIGEMNGGTQVSWEGEDEEASETEIDTSDLVLGAYKAIATLRRSNDVIRKGSVRAAEMLAADLAAAMALAFDAVGLIGKGPKKPTGIIHSTGITKKAFAGTDVDKIISDLKGMVADVLAANIPMEGAKPFYFMTSTTMMHLGSLRDGSASGTGGWVFPGLQDLKNPTIFGYPVGHTESLAGQKVMGFGLAQELYFGDAVPLEIELGENGNDFKRDRKTLRAVQEGDWKPRRPKAFSIRTGVTY